MLQLNYHEAPIHKLSCCNVLKSQQVECQQHPKKTNDFFRCHQPAKTLIIQDTLQKFRLLCSIQFLGCKRHTVFAYSSVCFPPLTRERRAVDIFILFLNKPFFHNVESTFKNSATYIDRHDKGRHFYSFCKNDIICLHDDGFKKIKNYVIIAFDNRYLFCLDKAGYVTMKSDNSFVSILLKK